MDRDEAIRLLTSGWKGVKRWNEWRRENPDAPLPDLSSADWSSADFDNADLRNTNLVEANLGNAELSNADVRDVNLTRANLYGADCHCADFSGANLKATKLGNADLSGAILSGANLDDSNLHSVDLGGADVRGANLCKAFLNGANLQNADLRGSTFTGASLSGGANLTDANLRDVNLRGAELYGAVLQRSDLREADLSKAQVGKTTWADVDLSQVKGLETLRHLAPSTIGIDTLLKSGELPDEFLLGCGVPETILPYVRSLHTYLQPVQFYSCFISYSHKDEEFAQRLHGRLRQEGLRVWYAPEDMKGGKKLHHQIDEAIRLYDKLLLVLSEASMNSEWVATEIYKARQREIKEKRQVLFPIRLVDFERIKKWELFDADTGKDLAREVREYFIPDFSDWKDHDKFEVAFARLLADLKRSAEATPRDEP